MLAKLYNKLPEYHTDAILEAAVSGEYIVFKIK